MKLETAITAALEFENRIRDLYIEAAHRTDDPDGKNIFQRLAEDEQHHVDYLESRLDEWRRRGEIDTVVLESSRPDKAAVRKLDHLSHTGFWYGFEEFDMEQI